MPRERAMILSVTPKINPESLLVFPTLLACVPES